MVNRKGLATILLVSATAFAAASPATGAPPIAYAQLSGTHHDLYLINPDGTGRVLLYSSPNRTNIGQVDMNPAANQLVVVESGSTGFKLIAYTAAGVRTSVTAVNDGCRVNGIDFHPSDGSLLVSRWCQSPGTLEVRRYANGAYDGSALWDAGNPQTNAVGGVRWLGDGSGFLLASANATTGSQIARHGINNPAAPVTLWSNSSAAIPQWFDVARCSGALDSSCSKALVTWGADIREISFDDFGQTGDTVAVSGATDGHYSPDNSQILHRVQTRNGYQLKIDSQVLVAKGSFAGKDWRP